MLNTAEKLFELGVTLLWLRKKSKRPIFSKWTTLPRDDDFEGFKKIYQEGFNLGARLGEVSKLEGGYLAAIDVDVKSSDARHREEAHAALKELLGDKLAKAPVTLSGRGNGSLHVWVKTETPIRPKRIRQSHEVVEVHMPSVKPSTHDIKTLGQEKCDFGSRSRHAWEISLMGEGQQIVVPPSVHPDTGKKYVWKREMSGDTQPPLIEPSSWGESNSQKDFVRDALVSATSRNFIAAQGPFEYVDVDLDLVVGLDTKTVAMIRYGEDCTDRSQGLYFAAEAMVKLGMSRNEILSVLSEPGTYLGDSCFEHAKTNDRNRAVKWLASYTVDKAIGEFSAALDFANEVEVTNVDPEEAEALAIELTSYGSWEHKLERSGEKGGFKVKNTLKNLMLIVEHAFDGERIFRFNNFRNVVLFAADTPWGGKEGNELRQIDFSFLKVHIIEKFDLEPSDDKLYEAVSVVAHRHGFHPVRDWLNALVWDGVPRVDTWLRDYAGATEEEPYLSAISRKTLCALVARVMTPGCKFDHMLVLEGFQGIGKSTLLRELASPPFFSDAIINMGDKDAVVNQFGIWLHELGELGSLNRSDEMTQKAFITRQVDQIRLPYGRVTEFFPRQIVFVGTTNADDYLKDPTGNRRFWPCYTTKCDFNGLRAARDQLFAEAVALWFLGEPLYLEKKECRLQAEEIQESRLELDPMDEYLETAIAKYGGWERLLAGEPPIAEGGFDLRFFRLQDAFGSPDAPWGSVKADKYQYKKAGSALRKMKFSKKKCRVDEGPRCWYWSPTSEP